MPRPRRKPRGIASRVMEANPNATAEEARRVSRNIHRRLREDAQKAKQK